MKKLCMIILMILAGQSAHAQLAEMCFTNFLENIDTNTVFCFGYCNVRLNAAKTEIVDGGETNTFDVMRSNWGYIQGDGDQSCQETVTFSNAYSSIPDVVVNCAGYKANSVPTNRGDSAGTVAAWASAQMIQTNQFTVVIMASQNIATNVYAIYTWVAKPQGDE